MPTHVPPQARECLHGHAFSTPQLGRTSSHPVIEISRFVEDSEQSYAKSFCRCDVSSRNSLLFLFVLIGQLLNAAWRLSSPIFNGMLP